MIKKHQSHIIASVGTLLVMLLIFLLLWWLHMTYVKPIEEEGIVVTFGYAEEDGGESDSKQQKTEPKVKHSTTKPTPARSSKNDYIVQEDDESLAMKKKTDDPRRKDNDDEQDRLKREQEAQDIQDLGKNLFGNASTNAGGDGSGPGRPQNPVGKGSGIKGGSQWQLSGRDCKSLPRPEKKHNQAGKVVVNITVDENGNVTGVSLGEGSTISERATIQLALNAAWKAKFTPGDRPQRGTITYIFKLN